MIAQTDLSSSKRSRFQSSTALACVALTVSSVAFAFAADSSASSNL